MFTLELLISAHENSEWLDGKLVIAGNHGPIHLLQTAFYAVKLELQRRDAVVVMRFLHGFVVSRFRARCATVA